MLYLSRHNQFQFWTVFALAMLLSGCGSREHRVIELDSSTFNHGLRMLSCELRYQGVVDQRRSSRLGDASLHTHEITNLVDYLDEQINAMLLFGDSGPDLTVELRHAYAQGKAMRGFYTIVLSIGIGDDSTVVRGRHDVTNWTGSSNEFQRGLTTAGNQALRTLHALLAESEYCQPTAS